MANSIARKLVLAPNQQMKLSSMADEKTRQLLKPIISESLQIPVGRPGEFMAADIIEPGYYKLSHTMEVKTGEKGENIVSLNVNFQARDATQPKQDPRGTVVLLHGIFMTKEAMLHWGFYLAERGYRSVLVDLRGHGHSTGKWITYGQLESTDMMQVADELERRGLAGRELGVIGVSYGAVVGIHWAARDPRIKALVLLQPYSDIESAIIGVARGNFGSIAKSISDQTFHDAIPRAASKAQFSWAEVDVLSAVRRLRIPLLIYHGKEDNWISPSHSEAIASVFPPGSQLHVLPGEDHTTLSMRLDPIATTVVSWLEARLANSSAVRSQDKTAIGRPDI